VGIDTAFAISQTTGALRRSWDPFIHEQHLLDGATHPGKGVRTQTTSRHRLTMVSEYTSYRPPTQVGMKMVDGPAFFAAFGGGWSFTPVDDDTTDAVWRYTFTIRPRWLAPIADRIGVWLLGRDIAARIGAFRNACRDPAIVAAALEQTGLGDPGVTRPGRPAPRR
jgi:hypothetical protein